MTIPVGKKKLVYEFIEQLGVENPGALHLKIYSHIKGNGLNISNVT